MRNRGRLFGNADKRKPSQPDMRGECTIDGTSYEILGFLRQDQLELTVAPARGDKNTYPPDAFRGSLDPAPKARRNDDEAPVWVGSIAGEESRFEVRAFQKQGKSGPYLTLLFEAAEPPVD